MSKKRSERRGRATIPFSQRELFCMGRVRRLRGQALREVAFPIGGIGTGTVSLGGRGQVRDWEIFNRPAKGKELPYTFFSIWAKASRQKPVARVLERQMLPPYSSGHGLPPSQVSGLPRLKEATFLGEYPFAWIDFADDALPVRIALEAFNPFIPMNDKDSGIPLVIFQWIVDNLSSKTVNVTLAFSLLNAVGYDGQATLASRRSSLFGRNLNELLREDGLVGIKMTSAKYAQDHPQFGSMALVTTWEEITFSLRWERAGWWDDVQNFWDDFAEDGRLPDDATTDPSPDGQTDVATLGLCAKLKPGAKVKLPFFLTWHFPNLINYWNSEEAVKGKLLGNWYATHWVDAWEVARYTCENLERLERETRQFHRAFFDSSLPSYVLEAVSANISTIRTTTCLRTSDGRFNAFEGCSDNAGCCPMNCTHVWNYEQSLAHLFPSLERTMRLTDFKHNVRPDGSMAFRTLLPLVGRLWALKPAADGQMGCIMKVYREWQQSGDMAFLKEIWDDVQRALEFAWQDWDADKDGVMEGEQHNTYDIEFYGPNPMTGTLYLGALRAAEEMALSLGEEAKAQEYRAVYEKGKERMSRELWNGEWFVQKLEDVEAHRYQFGEGCLSDQLLGQWFATVVGLGYLLPPERIRRALTSIFRHNWRSNLSDHQSVQRVYALNDECGLLLCTWPRGGRPSYPFPYADEVWTGFEYQVAAHLIYEGLVEEGLAIVKGARDRHNGERRNPWDEFECGHHYARAMSSWSLLTALSGYYYSAQEKKIAFSPRLRAENFRSFFTAGTAWGSFEQKASGKAMSVTLNVLWGEVALKTLSLRWVGQVRLGERSHLPRRGRVRVKVKLPASPVVHAAVYSTAASDTPILRLEASILLAKSARGEPTARRQEFEVDFSEPVCLRAGEMLRVSVS